MSAATPASLDIGQTVGPFAVSSSERWVSTGVLLDHGATYEISADDSKWVDWHIASCAAGQERPTFSQSLAQWALRCKQGRWFQLIGAAGHSDDHCFPVGKFLRWTYEGHGGHTPLQLHLFANDAWFAYFNNHGSVNVTIQRVG